MAIFLLLMNNASLPMVMFSPVCPAETKGVGMGTEQKNLEQHMICTYGTKVSPSHPMTLHIFLSLCIILPFGEEEDIKHTRNVSQKTNVTLNNFILIRLHSQEA